MRGEITEAAVRPAPPASPAEKIWNGFVSIISHRDLVAVVVFCSIGYLVAINIIIRFPDFGALASELMVYP
jgi:hypothetical protein